MLSQIHDCTLLGLNVEWKSKVASLNVLNHKSEIQVIKFINYSNIIIPQLQPWGPSVSINEAIVKDLNGYKTIDIEMQSGDVIKIDCKEIIY